MIILCWIFCRLWNWIILISLLMQLLWFFNCMKTSLTCLWICIMMMFCKCLKIVIAVSVCMKNLLSFLIVGCWIRIFVSWRKFMWILCQMLFKVVLIILREIRGILGGIFGVLWCYHRTAFQSGVTVLSKKKNRTVTVWFNLELKGSKCH